MRVPLTLADRVEQLDEIFDLRRIMQRPDSAAQVEKYYNKSSLGYALLHSTNGSIHMALNPDGVFHKNGYYRAPDLVWSLLKPLRPSRILELGAGTGFNMERLGTLAPNVVLHGIDITARHIREARKRLREASNIVLDHGDFEKLPYRDNYFDGIYSIESFCHALDLDAAFSSAVRALRPRGLLVIVDAWRTPKADVADQSLLEALSLTERSMAVARTIELEAWLERARMAGLDLDYSIDLSEEVLPNLERFERWAMAFMKRRRLAITVGKVLRLRLLENVIAGYLMAESVRSGFHTYQLVVLRKT